MKFTDPQGRTLEVNSPDGSMPSEAELDQMFSMKYGGNIAPTQTEAWANDSENRLAQRPSVLAEQARDPATLDRLIKHPLGTTLRTIQGAGELLQGVPSSIALDLQRGKPQDILPNLGKVVTGERPAQYGDVYVGAGASEPVASTAGLLTDTASIPGGMEGAVNIVKGGANLVKGGVKNIGKFFNFDQKALTISQKVRQVASASKQSAVDQFGADLDKLSKANPNKSVSLQNVIDDIRNNPDLPYEARTVFNKTPILRDMLKNPGAKGYVDPSNVSLKNTQEIINYINTKIPKSIKANSLDILDAQHDIRAAQLNAFPEMEQARASYGRFAEDYKLIKSALNPKATPAAIRTNFSDNPAVKDAATRVLGPVMKDMEKYRKQVGTVKLIKRLTGWAAIGAAAGVGGKGASDLIKHVAP